MSELRVVEVESSREWRQFLELPWQLYANDPLWVPPLRRHQKEVVGRAKHPFYQTAQAQAFLALQDDRPVGRILAIVNQAHNERYESRDGFFGFFETIDDKEVAHGLLNSAEQWLANQGMDSIRGPANPSLNYEIGMLIEGFDTPPTFMMTYNPPFYPQLVEGAGYGKLKDAFAFGGHIDMLEHLDQKLGRLAAEVVERFNVKIRPMNPKRFDDEVRLFLDLYNRSLVGTWGFVPLSAAEVDHMSGSLKQLLVPELAFIAEIDDEPIGALLGILDYNPRIKAIDGRLFPLGFLKLLRNKRDITRMRVVSANVVPEYQQWGVGLAFFAQLEHAVVGSRIETAEFSWVLEDNHLSRKSLERGGANLEKTYRIYEKQLPSEEQSS